MSASQDRPRVLFSRCLGFEACRYDGGIIRSDPVQALTAQVEVVTVCPEAEIGLGTPRPSLHLVADAAQPRLWQAANRQDHTESMLRFSQTFLDSLQIDGAILKSRSPSCALLDAKLHAAGEDATAIGLGPGIFAAALLHRWPNIARIDEGTLLDADARHHFLSWLFTRHRFRRACEAGDISALQDFQARHKYFLMAQSETTLRELGRILASHRPGDYAQLRDAYGDRLQEVLAQRSTPARHVNVLQHCFGHVSDRLSPQERRHFAEALTRYRSGSMPLTALVRSLQAWALRCKDEYLLQQVYLEPYPSDLMAPSQASNDTDPRAAL